MRRAFSIIIILLCMLAFTSATVKAESLRQIELNKMPVKFSKFKFRKLLRANGINGQEYKKIGGMRQIINSLSFKNKKWFLKASPDQLKKLIKFSGGKIKLFGNVLSFNDITLDSNKNNALMDVS